MKIDRGIGEALAGLELEVVSCRRCPRLVNFREHVARKRRRYIDWEYWGKPVPGFGDTKARLLVVGLAPAPHGGNRTGRVFTGDRSGDFLFGALHIAGFASQPTSVSRNDGLRVQGAYLTAAVKCAPPGNKPETREIVNCSRFLGKELEIFREAVAVLCLGQTAYRSTLNVLMAQYQSARRIPRFRHGLELSFGSNVPRVFASYHPSPRNTQTGKLTERMLLSLLARIRRIVMEDG
jgi:uracil-DNA glycosylase family 4